MPKSGMFGSSTLGDLIAQSLRPTTQADVNAAFGVRPGKPRYTIDRPQPLKPSTGNEAHWRKRLANQGQITATKPTISEKVETTLGDILGKALSDNYARHVAKRAMAPINDWTPVGNVTGMEEGAKTAYHGMTRGDLASGALGAGVFALNAIPFGGSVKRQGENALMALMRDESGAIRAWHGSPHDFDRFDMSKIGTGEGAQAYGHGLYFAENPQVAREYAQNLGRSVNLRGVGFNPDGTPNRAGYVAELLDSVGAGRIDDIREGLRALEPNAPAKQIDQWLAEGKAKFDAANTGRLYEVNINAEPEDFLDYDAPIADQPLAMEVLRNLDLEKTGALSRTKSMLRFVKEGRELPEYRTKGRELLNAVSNYGENRSLEHGALMPYGIKGVRYLDQGSRGAGQGSRNFVVFDDSLIDILNKF